MNAYRLSRHLTGFALIGLLGGCDVDQRSTYVAPKCYVHQPLDYAPILVNISVTANYTLDDPQSFHNNMPGELFDALDDVNPNKYELADGVTPNLYLTLTLTNDGQNHYGAYLNVSGNGEGYLFNYSWPQNYVTGRKLVTDVAAMTDRFVTEGWNRNCN